MKIVYFETKIFPYLYRTPTTAIFRRGGHFKRAVRIVIVRLKIFFGRFAGPGAVYLKISSEYRFTDPRRGIACRTIVAICPQERTTVHVFSSNTIQYTHGTADVHFFLFIFLFFIRAGRYCSVITFGTVSTWRLAFLRRSRV